MIKARSPAEIVGRRVDFPGKVIADIGCGTGDFVRWMTQRGAKVTGVDTAEMIARAERYPRTGDESYRAGSAQDVEFEAGSLDLLTYIASFHHVPAPEMPRALENCRRFLKPGGMAAFVEPMGREGSYFEIIRLIEDERDVQALAARAIAAAGSLGFSKVRKEVFYVERSLDDYAALLDLFVDDPGRRALTLETARSVTERMARDAGKTLKSFRYRSICRLDILRKT